MAQEHKLGEHDIILRFCPGRGYLPIVVQGCVSTYSRGNFDERYRGSHHQDPTVALEVAIEMAAGMDRK
jgi:hypothetical protein